MQLGQHGRIKMHWFLRSISERGLYRLQLPTMQRHLQAWRAAYVSSIVELEATRAGARRPNVVARLIDLETVNAPTIDGVRLAAEQAVQEVLKEAPELAGKGGSGLISQGVRTRPVTNAEPRDPDAWLRERARR